MVSLINTYVFTEIKLMKKYVILDGSRPFFFAINHCITSFHILEISICHHYYINVEINGKIIASGYAIELLKKTTYFLQAFDSEIVQKFTTTLS